MDSAAAAWDESGTTGALAMEELGNAAVEGWAMAAGCCPGFVAGSGPDWIFNPPGRPSLGPFTASLSISVGRGFSRAQEPVSDGNLKTSHASWSPLSDVHVSIACCNTPDSQAAMKSPWYP